MGGITGRMYQQFALTIAVSVVLSAINALTLSPALCSLLLKPKKEGKGWLARGFGLFNRGFNRATEGYGRWVNVLLRRGSLTVLLLLVFFGGAGGLGPVAPHADRQTRYRDRFAKLGRVLRVPVARPSAHPNR